jgi:hypothetical protein
MKKQNTSTLKYAALAAWKVVSRPKTRQTVLRGIQSTSSTLKNVSESIHEGIEPHERKDIKLLPKKKLGSYTIGRRRRW